MATDARARWSNATFLIGFVAALYLLWQVLAPFLVPLALALVFAIVLGPLHERIVAGLGGRRALGTTISVVASFLLLVIPLGLIVWRLVLEAIPLVQDLAAWIGPGGFSGVLEGRLPPRLDRLLDELPIEGIDDRVATTLQRFARYLGGVATSLPARSAELFTDMIVFLTALSALFLRGPKLADWIAELVPMEPRYTGDLSRTIAMGLRTMIAASFVTALIQAVIGVVGFWIAGVPHAIALAAMMAFFSFVFSLIPVLGSGLVWGPAAIWLAVSGHPWKGLFLAAWGILVLGSVDNIVKPLFAKNALRLPPSLVLITLLGGVLAFGPIGALYGPLVAAIVGAFARIWREDFLTSSLEVQAEPESTTRTELPVGLRPDDTPSTEERPPH